jgi:hypothetical protein
MAPLPLTLPLHRPFADVMRAPGLESLVLGSSPHAEYGLWPSEACPPRVFHVKHFRKNQWF